MDRDAALADFEAARLEWESAFAQVPDGALAYLKAGDDYALGGLQVHVNWVLTHYRRVLDGMIAGRFGDLGPQDSPGEGDAAGQKAKAGLAKGERPWTRWIACTRRLPPLYPACRKAIGHARLPSSTPKARILIRPVPRTSSSGSATTIASTSSRAPTS
jgi:hypothetical protein